MKKKETYNSRRKKITGVSLCCIARMSADFSATNAVFSTMSKGLSSRLRISLFRYVCVEASFSALAKGVAVASPTRTVETMAEHRNIDEVVMEA